ncbi:hypothetical protein [Dyadobacter sp. CY323]|uniref:hypothetical protein n=1 Tax=Dyadobacter sp. CY323 TaxID=2907302 RepID=UPI001F168C3F|nr:hypothetical protein [Dyadobacter sp. CY323]MCE6992102.1 hypothetical protein [Dyadobacter sp. CY323]
MAARANEAVLNKEVNLFVNKGTTGSPNFVMVGCGTSKDYGGAINVLKLNCDSGTRKVHDGEDAEYDLNFTGFVFEYASANVAANVSRREFETWFKTNPQIAREYRLAGKYEDDLVRDFSAIIASFRESGNNGEARTYNMSFQFDGLPEFSDQGAGEEG